MKNYGGIHKDFMSILTFGDLRSCSERVKKGPNTVYGGLTGSRKHGLRLVEITQYY